MKKKIEAVAAAAIAAASIALAPITGMAESGSYIFTDLSALTGTDTTYVYKDKTYDVKATEAGAAVNIGLSGITMKVGADNWYYTADKKEYNGISYAGRITGFDNPKPADGTGVYCEFVCDSTVQPGTLEIMYQVGAGKGFWITEDDSAVTGYDGIKYEDYKFAEKVTQSTVFKVSANHTYRVYANGSKASFYGVTYQDSAAAEQAKKKAFAEEIEAYAFDNIKGDNIDESHIDSDLVLTDNYPSRFGSCDVSWSSSDESVIDKNGVVSAKKTDTVVELIGKFSVQEDDTLVAEKKFTLTVLADADDASAVEAAKEALTIGDTTAVKRDIVLPVSGKKGTTVTWSSSDESVVAADGKITRYPGEDKTAVLTAEISRGDASVKKEFTVTVVGYIPVTVDTYLYADAAGNTRFTPIDGGVLKKITFTSSMQTPGENDSVVVVVYNSEGHVKGIKGVAITADEYDKSCALDVSLPMDSTDTFKVMALNIGSLFPYIDAVSADDTVTNGAKLYVVGDSTAAVYGNDRYPRTGWAQKLQNYFSDNTVVDLALSGRSSKSFKAEKNYETLQNELKPGDYLIVQFGHNDSKKDDAARYTDPSGDRFTEGSYKKSMYEYIELARDKGANPILATSISRRQTSDSSLEQYVKATKELGEELDIPVLDLYGCTNSYINNVGVEEAKSMFNYVKVNDSRFINDPEYAASTYKTTADADNTHINKYGADIISQWATEEMKRLGMPLAEKVNDYKAVYPLPSYNEAVSAE